MATVFSERQFDPEELLPHAVADLIQELGRGTASPKEVIFAGRNRVTYSARMSSSSDTRVHSSTAERHALLLAAALSEESGTCMIDQYPPHRLSCDGNGEPKR